MSYYNSVSKQVKKKVCIMCSQQPINILVLACDHSICLNCAYNDLKESRTNKQIEQIQFRCRCSQITYFDQELVKQIESTIQSDYLKKHMNYQENNKNKPQIQSNNEDSFIAKMKKQYLLDDQTFKFEKNSKINTHKPKSFQQDIKMSRKQVSQIQKGNEYEISSKKSSDNNQLLFKGINHQRIIKCKFHKHYDLSYFCQNCKEIVCSQCLLRGNHKNHENQQLNIVLTRQLPTFINQSTSQLLKQVDKIQKYKEIISSQTNHKTQEILKIRSDALSYFSQIKKNIQRQERQVLCRCDIIIQKYKKQEDQIKLKKSDVQKQICEHIKGLKSLKFLYEKYVYSLNQEQRDHSKLRECLLSQFIQQSRRLKHHFINSNQKSQEKTSFKEDLNRKQVVSKEIEQINKKMIDSCEHIRQSLLFQSFANFKHKIEQLPYKKQPMNQNLAQNHKKLEQDKLNIHHSYISTQNSFNSSKQIKRRKFLHSPSISPYKSIKNDKKYENTELFQKLKCSSKIPRYPLQPLDKKQLKKNQQEQQKINRIIEIQQINLNKKFKRTQPNQLIIKSRQKSRIPSIQEQKCSKKKQKKQKNKYNDSLSNKKQNKQNYFTNKSINNSKSVKKTYKNITPTTSNINRFKI